MTDQQRIDALLTLCRDLYEYAKARTPLVDMSCPHTWFGKLRDRLRALEGGEA